MVGSFANNIFFIKFRFLLLTHLKPFTGNLSHTTQPSTYLMIILYFYHIILIICNQLLPINEWHEIYHL